MQQINKMSHLPVLLDEVAPTNAAPKVLAFSCNFGAYEQFNPMATGPRQGYDRVVLTDQALSEPGIRFISSEPDAANTLSATHMLRLAKLRPHLFFADYDWIFYIDNSATLQCDPLKTITEIESHQGGAAPAGRYLFAHQRVSRSASVHEKGPNRAGGLSPPSKALSCRWFSQRSRTLYEHDDGPEDGGKATDAFNDAWNEHFLTFAPRDQISLSFMLWPLKYPVRLMPQNLFDLVKWPVFKKWRREKFQRAQEALAAQQALAV
jgi:hypothetical protein